MLIDSRKWTIEHIEKNVGRLGAQIIVNQLIVNKWKMWFIGNTDGNSLYTVDLSSGEKVIVGFTVQILHCVVYPALEVSRHHTQRNGDGQHNERRQGSKQYRGAHALYTLVGDIRPAEISP